MTTRPPQNDPRFATARAKGGVNPENSNTDYSNHDAYPYLYELRVKGVTLDLRPSITSLVASKISPGEVYRLEQRTGIKTLITSIGPRS